MLFFRSEELLDEWLRSNHAQPGAILSVPKLWELSQPWYGGRMLASFHGRTMEQVQQIFKQAGLTSDFWQGT